MSMYTQLLDAAFEERAPVPVDPREGGALDAARRWRGELEQGTPAATDPDAVPVVLAREIGYDLALLELAGILGIDTDPSRFDQPLSERARLERAFLDLGIALQMSSESDDSDVAPPPRT
jgi:hypothetical protein